MSYANDTVVLLGPEALTDPTGSPRCRLSNCTGKFLREKAGRIVFLGVLTTQMHEWSKLIDEDLRSRFPAD